MVVNLDKWSSMVLEIDKDGEDLNRWEIDFIADQVSRVEGHIAASEGAHDAALHWSDKQKAQIERIYEEKVT